MDVSFRVATADDLPALVGMLADDHLGAQREDFSDPLNPAYIAAFNRIDADPHNELVVAVVDNAIVGTLQITIIPNLSFIGSPRCLIEAVRVSSDLRGQGIGGQMMNYAIDRAREEGCVMVELASNLKRPDAIRFYKRLGFDPSHQGFKLMLKK